MSNSEHHYIVTDGNGAGWGRYTSEHAARERRDNLRTMRDSALNPSGPSAQFYVGRAS